MKRRVSTALALGAALWMAAGAFAQSDFGFMPDGGKQTLTRLVQSGAMRIEDIAQRSASEEEWSTTIGAADSSLDARAVTTLASYLAVNLPAAVSEGMVERLPLDGKELAIANCQFCHSFFTGYLAHDRDAEGWRAIFKSPFHMELPMTATERETFARYSALNMPIAYEDVPEELRF